MLASEPAKILLVRDRLPTLAAISSVAIENACYIASVIVMLVAGAVVFVNVTNLPAGLQVSVEVVFVGAARRRARGCRDSPAEARAALTTGAPPIDVDRARA